MNRSRFLVIAGAVGCVFGLSMILVPVQMLAGMTTITSACSMNAVRWMGPGILAVGVINIFARKDPGSDALRAIMTGNIVLHLIAWSLDFTDYRAGIVTPSGFALGTVVHALLAAGFVYYYARMGPRAA